jgi:hypothetical protein
MNSTDVQTGSALGSRAGFSAAGMAYHTSDLLNSVEMFRSDAMSYISYSMCVAAYSGSAVVMTRVLEQAAREFACGRWPP